MFRHGQVESDRIIKGNDRCPLFFRRVIPVSSDPIHIHLLNRFFGLKSILYEHETIRENFGNNKSCKKIVDKTMSKPYNDTASAKAVKTSRGGAVAARRAHNPKVVGSNPSPATIMAA